MTINKANGSVFVQCFASGCGLSRTLGEEELTQHESTSFAVADFITGQLNFSGPYRPLLTDRLLRLGKLEYPNGEYDVLLARGISWEDADHIFHLAMPRSARTNVLMLSLHGAEVETGNSRIVQVPLIDLIAVENRILVLRKDRILPKLRGVYSDAKETVLEESKKRFIAVFQEAVQAGQVKRGDKELWKKKAESEFGILAGTFNGIWREHAPESLKKPGALPKPKAASVYPLPPHIIRDGEIHRFGEQNRCWYAAHDDYAVAGDWKAERERVSWKAHDGHASTPQERRSLQEKSSASRSVTRRNSASAISMRQA